MDIRFVWFKEIIYKFLLIDIPDPAFEELLEKNTLAKECLQNFVSGTNKEKTCTFFYCTVEEEEVEVEDAYEQTEPSETAEGSLSSESGKLESENASTVDKTEEKGLDDIDDTVSSVILKVDSPDYLENTAEIIKSKRFSRKSTTSLLQVIKKNVLHICLNVTKYLPSERYVYFLQCKLEPIPLIENMEETFNIMMDNFEFGSINQHPLISMNKIISYLYFPILEHQNWISSVLPSNCQVDNSQLSLAFKELYKEVREFLKATTETVSQIETPFMFQAPNIITNCTVEELTQERSFVIEAEELTNEWTLMIADLLEQTVQKKPPENDLLGEINFWRRQKFTLSTCYDHLRQSSIQQTIEILQMANSDIEDFQSKIRQVEEHLETASDNFSYLSLMEPLAKNLLPEKSFEDTQKAVEDIFVLLKMIWIQSNYYKDIPNMCRLIKGIAILLKEKVKYVADIENLFRKTLPEIHKIVINSSELLSFWKEQYLKECENVKKYGGSYWWGFDIRAFFTETDHMIQVCSDLEKITVMLEELYNIFNTNLKYFVQDVKGLDVLKVRVFGITSRIQYANFDIFDPIYKSDWGKIIETFNRDVKNFEDEIKLYISKMFRSTLSWENAYILTKSFSSVSISLSIQDFINKSRDDMLKQFIREIYEKENEFLSYKDEPPIFEGIPQTMSSILWVQDLLLKLSQPISQICDHSDLTKKEYEVQERFKKAELLLKEYKLEKYEAWRTTSVKMLSKFLQEKILREYQLESTTSQTKNFQNVLKYQVNFPIHLEEVSTEAKLLEYYGYEIPTLIKNIILQERLYYEYRHEIRVALENLKRSASQLSEDEISILGMPIENLCSVLDNGVHGIQWESSEIPDFVKKVKRAVNVFRSLLSQIQNVFLEIDKRIESLSDYDLFQFYLCEGKPIPTCEEFFDDAETEMDKKVKKIVDVHSSLQLLLRNLEKITCKTATGETIQMKQYYHRCEERILKSLLKMTLSNLEYFNGEVLENFIFPYLEAASHSENELVLSSLTRAELIFVTFIQNAVESTRKVIRWLDGTCKMAAPFYLEETKEEMEFSYYLDICMHPEVKNLVLNILNSFFTFMNKINKI